MKIESRKKVVEEFEINNYCCKEMKQAVEGWDGVSSTITMLHTGYLFARSCYDDYTKGGTTFKISYCPFCGERIK